MHAKLVLIIMKCNASVIVMFKWSMCHNFKGGTGQMTWTLLCFMQSDFYSAVHLLLYCEAKPSPCCIEEILLCSANFENTLSDRRVRLDFNDCECGRKYCRENAAHLVNNQFKKVSLKDIAGEYVFNLIELFFPFSFSLNAFSYNAQQTLHASSELDNLVCHVHLKKELLLDGNISMQDICEKFEGTVDSLRKNELNGIDVYNFGHTPEQSFDKPIFEDIAQLQDDLENQMVDVGSPGDSSWEKVSSILKRRKMKYNLKPDISMSDLVIFGVPVKEASPLRPTAGLKIDQPIPGSQNNDGSGGKDWGTNNEQSGAGKTVSKPVPITGSPVRTMNYLL
ncbi:hypothetical protein RHSIM_Rhsim10G0108200 [Rhododendron simsii]|uniref:Uncharacterized protein n=1 Tax=Rhododendron simsii TaxID=118357 RepID=A0A834LCL8_RHOSS|nr:hypothetical protein RHSIM_Rhsim10G0108200 [Rhododendron simsii]